MNSERLHTDLVLVGGGHAHVGVVRMLAMQPVPGVRITLVNSASETPYSGMLPGLISGQYSWDQCHIDLARLCQWAGVRLIRARVTGIDPATKRLHLIDAPSGLIRQLDYDVLSLNPGATPELSVPGAREHVLPVKPIAHFVQQFERRVLARANQPDRSVVVGAGVGAVEVVLAAQQRIPAHQWGLVLGAKGLLPGAPESVRRQVQRTLDERGIQCHHGPVTSVTASTLTLPTGELGYDHCLWNTQAAAPGWLRDSGLPTDSDGFVSVSPDLSVQGYPDIFIAGDAAALGRPKAGVFAVRAGPVLAGNLARRLRGESTVPWQPQRRWLAILNLGQGRAIGWRGRWSVSGRWVWRWKDWIDQRFMMRFGDHLPTMPTRKAIEQAPLCMGCGSKASAQSLGPVDLGRDAVQVPATGAQLTTVDTLTDPLGDPWWLGRLAAMHAAGDLIAAGTRPAHYLVSTAVNDHHSVLVARDLAQARAGLATIELGQCHGGHSWLNQPANMTLTLSGPVDEASQVSSRPLQAGMKVWLSRPQGAGLLLAGAMQGRVRGRYVDEWLMHAYPLQNDLEGLPEPVRMTDVTGFGLAGHLHAMLPDWQIRWSGQIPAWDGIDYQVQAVLAPANFELAASRLSGLSATQQQLVCDPQTLGGLLACWPADVTPGAPWVQVAVLDSPLV